MYCNDGHIWGVTLLIPPLWPFLIFHMLECSAITWDQVYSFFSGIALIFTAVCVFLSLFFILVFLCFVLEKNNKVEFNY